MGRAHDRGKRPADDAPIEGNMSALHRAVTGLSTKRGTHQSGQRDSKGEQRKLSTPASEAQPAVYATAAIRCAVHHRLKSVVREIRTLRSVGAGGG